MVQRHEHSAVGETAGLQRVRLLAQHAIYHVCQRLSAQHLASLGDQFIIEWRGKRLFKQPAEVLTQARLRRSLTGIALGPPSRHALRQPPGITSLAQIEHQVGAQVIQ